MRAWSRIVEVLRGIDWASAAMASVAALAVGWALWLRFGPPSRAEPPLVGSLPPPLRLLDVKQAEPVVLLGLRGKVVWVVFWSARGPSARADLQELETIWRRLRARPQFSMIAAATDTDHPDEVRATLAEIKATLPAYLANPETRTAYGVGQPPLHVILGEDGRVVAVARGGDAGTVNRLARQVEQRLDLLEPRHNTRFAWVRAE
jgi:hypothetical protein